MERTISNMLLFALLNSLVLLAQADIDENVPELFIAEGTGVWRMNLDGSNKTRLACAVNATTLDFHNNKRLVFWGDVATHKIYSKDMFDSSEPKVVIEGDENWKPRAIAVDYVNDNIYVMDQGGLKIDLFGLDGRKKAEYFKNNITQPDQGDWTDMRGPSTLDIAVDPINGYVFFGEYNRVWRATLNFSEVTYMAHKSFNSGIMIEPSTKRYYYADVNYFMWEYTYDGKQLGMANAYYVDHPTDSFRGTGMSPRTVAKYDGIYYYFDRRQVDIPGVQRLAKFYIKMVRGDFHNVWTVRVRHPSMQRPSNVNNTSPRMT